jgi:hypothetical protein
VSDPSGRYADEGPDLHVVLDGYRYISCPLFATDGQVISSQIRGDSGSHRQHGILIACGPHVRSGTQIDNARIVDLAPTALYLLGHAVPVDMDGSLLYDLLDPAWAVQASNADQGQLDTDDAGGEEYVLSEHEQAELESRLKGLGYLG